MPYNFHHVGIIVSDLDRAISYYSSLGAGPFERLKSRLVEERWLGRPVDRSVMKAEVRMGRVGSLPVELIQPISGGSIWQEFLEQNGEGLHHLAFLVDDLDAAVSNAVANGAKVIREGKFADGGGLVYLSGIGGYITEFVRMVSP